MGRRQGRSWALKAIPLDVVQRGGRWSPRFALMSRKHGLAKPMGVDNPVLNGLAARCPKCGKGPLLHNVLSVRPTCPNCGQSFAFADTGDGPAVFAILLLGAVTLGGALFVEFRYDPPAWVHIVLWGLMIPLLATFMLRALKGLLINLQFINKAAEGQFDDR